LKKETKVNYSRACLSAGEGQGVTRALPAQALPPSPTAATSLSPSWAVWTFSLSQRPVGKHRHTVPPSTGVSPGHSTTGQLGSTTGGPSSSRQ
jgi:hypothetical protein